MASKDVLEKNLLDIESVIPHVQKEIPKSTASRIAGWSDDKLKSLRLQVKFPRVQNFRALIPDIIARFYNFYFTGFIDPNDNLVATVADACLLASTGDVDLWPIDNRITTLFYRNNTSKPIWGAKESIGALPELVYPVSLISETDKTLYKQLITDYSHNQSENFWSFVKRAHSDINTQGAVLSAEQHLMKLTGFLALTMWRAATKNDEQLNNAFIKAQYYQNLIALAEWPAENPFSPPCTACIRHCVNGLQKGLPTTSAMFTILANLYVQSRSPELNNTAISGYLSTQQF